MNEPKTYTFDEFTDEVLSNDDEVLVYLVSDPVIVRALAITAEVDAILANENRSYAIEAIAMEYVARRIIYSEEEAVERKHGSRA